jgi:hypothetical protein
MQVLEQRLRCALASVVNAAATLLLLLSSSSTLLVLVSVYRITVFFLNWNNVLHNRQKIFNG